MVETLKAPDLKDQLADNVVDQKELKQLDDFIKTWKYKEKPIGPVDLLWYGKEGNIKAKAFAQALDKLLDSKTMTKSDLDHVRSFYQPLRDFLRQSSIAILAPHESIMKETVPGADNWHSLIVSIDAKVNTMTQAINTQRLESFSLATGSLDSFVSALSLLKQSYWKPTDAKVLESLNKMDIKQKSLYEEKLSSQELNPSNLNEFLTIRKQYEKAYLKNNAADPQVQEFLAKMQTKENSFRMESIKEVWNKTISFEWYLNLQSLMEPFQKKITEIQDKYLSQIQTWEYKNTSLVRLYANIDSPNKNLKPFPAEAQKEIDDILANENRISLWMNFMSMIDSNSVEFADKKQIATVQTKFESVIRKTPDAVVNSLMKEICTLTDPQADRVFHNLYTKLLKDKEIDKDYRVTSLASVSGVIRDLAVTPKPSSTEIGTTRSLNQSFFDNVKEPEIVDINDKQLVTKVLESLAKFNIANPNIQETIITCPSKWVSTNWYGTLMLACQSKYPNLKNIKIQEADGITDISIKTIEKKVTKEPLKLDFPNLEANVIADKAALQERLSQNPDMKALIDNPNYKIMGWTFFGSASKSPNSVSEKSTIIDKNKDNKNISFVDKTAGTLDANDRNKDLAINRAGSVFDLFNSMPGKITGSIQIEYAVGGPTREEILKNNPNATEEDIANEYKKYQNSSLDLTLEKTDYVVQETAFTTIKTQAKDLALKMNYEQTPRASSTTWIGEKLRTVGWGVTSIFSFGGDGLQHPRHKWGCMCNYN